MIGIETIALSQKEFERASSRLCQTLANRPGGPKVGRRTAPIVAPRRIFDPASLLFQTQLRLKVRQVIESSRAPNRQTIRRVQREEPNTRQAFEMDIGAHVEFMKSARAWNWREKRR